jgi:hypothetical protein
MSCILRIAGEHLDVEALLAFTGLMPDRTWRNGQPGPLKGTLYSDSGAQFVASEANLDQFECQTEDVAIFLEDNLSSIAAASSFAGVERAVLDFGVCLPEGYVAQFSLLPLRLIRLAAQAGVAIQLSHYLCSDEKTNQG